MSSSAERITQFSKQEINELFQNSNRIFSNNAVTVLAAPRSKEYARVLLVTSRAVGSAVQRNLLRRRLKEIFRKEDLPKKLQFDLVVLTRKSLTNYSFEELRQLIEKIIVKLS